MWHQIHSTFFRILFGGANSNNVKFTKQIPLEIVSVNDSHSLIAINHQAKLRFSRSKTQLNRSKTQFNNNSTAALCILFNFTKTNLKDLLYL